MKSLRHLLLSLLFVGLVALEIGHGIFRLDTVREDRHRELLAGIELRHSDLAGQIRTRLEEERAHAAYLARLPAVRRLLRAREDDEPTSRALEADLLPYLVSFRGIDGVRVLDAAGRERFRCERSANRIGALALPRGLLQVEPDASIVALTRDARPGDVVLSDLAVDNRREEVPQGERQVLHFVTSVEEGAARAGILVLTVYAAPLLSAVRGFAPLPGVRSSLVARDGMYLASTVRSRERGGPAETSLRRDHPDAADTLLSGAEKVRTDDALFISLPTGETPWRLVTYVPDQALDAASSDLSWEYTWVVGSMVLTTLAIVVAGAFLVRISIREVELREAAKYERHQQEMERQMQVAERLGSLGLLTAGVAHEINNPLEGIENYLALLEREPSTPEKKKRYVEMIRYGFHRIRDIVRDLSTFARPNVLETTADLSRVVAHALRMVGYTKDFKGIRLRIEGLDAPLVVAGDPGRLEQVFINLLLNAAKAMGGAGEVHVTATSMRAEGEEPTRVQIVVEDTGPGIPEENLSRIFDPFFTTTDGTGLGLSISYGIIRAHGGTILAQNREEGGARFILRLPAAEAAAVTRHGERSST